MKLRFKTVLKTIFLAPFALMMGVGAGEGAAANDTNSGSAGVEPTTQQNGSDANDQPLNAGKAEKTFTQSEVNALMAKEKDQGRKAILKELGIDDVKNAKEGLQKYKEYLESQKTDLQKAQDAARQAEKDKEALQQQIEISNQKLTALSLGCPPDKIDDVCVLARSRMSETVTFEQAVEQIKQGYPDMFNQQTQNKGTGNNVNPQNKGTTSNNAGFGQRLASKYKSENKNPYFNS